MKTWIRASSTATIAFASTMAAAVNVTADGTALMVAQTSQYQQDITTGRTTMTPAQSAQYRAEYQAAKAQWAKMTPQQQAAAIASARTKKISELTAIERVGQRDDMVNETAAQSGALKAQADAAKASWDKMTPAEKQAVRKASWAKKRAELTDIEKVGQRDDTDILPW
jgi:predicted Fe-S protein YdhL (DUF1289 family)